MSVATAGVGGYGVGGLHDIWCGWQSVLILYLFSMSLLWHEHSVYSICDVYFGQLVYMACVSM